MAINGKRFAFWGIFSLVLLLGVASLFAVYGVRPAAMGGTGESSAYACFLSSLYLADVLCLCLIGGMKRQPGFLAAFAVVTGLLLAFPGWWGAPFYGIALYFGGTEVLLRLMGASLLLGGLLAFWGGMLLREKRGCGEPARPEPVPPITLQDVLEEVQEETDRED